MTSEMSRREFIRNNAAAAGAVAVGVGLGGNFLASAKDEDAIKKTRSYNPEMEYRRLGATGLWISAVCLGGHFKRAGEKIGIKNNGVALPKDPAGLKLMQQNRHDVLTRCMEHGINYVDACTVAEISLYGPALKGRRDKMYMGFAMWPECPRNKKYRTAKVLLETLERGMKVAQVDYVDVWRLVASDRNPHSPAEEKEFIEAFATAKQQGKVRFTGVSSHNRTWLTRLAKKYPEHYQVLIFPYQASTKELPKDSLFDAVRKHDIGTFGIKPFANNSLFHGAKDDEEKSKRARNAIRQILANPAITAPIPGLACVEEVDNVARAIKEPRQLSAAEAEELQRVSEVAMANLPPQYEWLRDWEYV